MDNPIENEATITIDGSYVLTTNTVTTTIPTGTVIVYYLEIDTLETLANSVTMSDYSGIEYETEAKEIDYYELVDTSDNTTRNLYRWYYICILLL